MYIMRTGDFDGREPEMARGHGRPVKEGASRSEYGLWRVGQQVQQATSNCLGTSTSDQLKHKALNLGKDGRRYTSKQRENVVKPRRY